MEARRFGLLCSIELLSGCFRGGARARGCTALPPPPSFTTRDGNELSGPGSLRCYAIVDKAENIPFVGVAIADALWRSGPGRIEFSAAGSMLVRCPIDCAVWQPERLDFAGPVVLGPGLVKRSFRRLSIDGDDIDTKP